MCNLPKSVKSGTIHLSPDHSITVHVLDNGQRVVDAEGLEAFMDWMESGGCKSEPRFDEAVTCPRHADFNAVAL